MHAFLEGARTPLTPARERTHSVALARGRTHMLAHLTTHALMCSLPLPPRARAFARSLARVLGRSFDPSFAEATNVERAGAAELAPAVSAAVDAGRELLRELEELQDALTDAARRSAP